MIFKAKKDTLDKAILQSEDPNMPIVKDSEYELVVVPFLAGETIFALTKKMNPEKAEVYTTVIETIAHEAEYKDHVMFMVYAEVGDFVAYYKNLESLFEDWSIF